MQTDWRGIVGTLANRFRLGDLCNTVNSMKLNRVIFGDCRDSLKQIKNSDISVNCCVTSPPYWGLRDYGHNEQIGHEQTPQDFVDTMVEVFELVKDCLCDDGTLWLNIGDSYGGSGKGPSGNLGKKSNERQMSHAVKPYKSSNIKPKDLILIPYMVAAALRDSGWYLRQDIIWSKPNPMPESVKDRCTNAHEHIFLFSKNKNYYFDAEAIKEPASPDNSVRDRDNTKMNNTAGRSKMNGLKTNHYEKRNKRNVWEVATKPYSGAHFAVYPPELITPCILAGSPQGGVVLDPFIGSGTTALVAEQNGRNWIGCELNKAYEKLQFERLAQKSIFTPLQGDG